MSAGDVAPGSAGSGSAARLPLEPAPEGPQARQMSGRAALVTGGGGHETPGGSVGYAVSRLLALHGARVAVLDRDPAAAARTIEEIAGAGGEAFHIAADVTSDADCARAVAEAEERFGRLDTLVNSVAGWSMASLFDVGPDRFDELSAVNFKGAWQMSRHAANVMRPGSAIVNISSAASQRPGTLYGLAKAGLEAFTRGAAGLLGPQGIRVNCVQIGVIWSAAVARNLPPEAREQRWRSVALQCEGSCWDAAEAVLFLASDRARWISGQVLSVDGGGPYRAPGSPGAPAAAAHSALAAAAHGAPGTTESRQEGGS